VTAGMPSCLRPIVRCISRMIATLIVVPIFTILQMLWPIKLTPLSMARLGHLALNTHLYVAGRELEKPRKRDFRIFFGAVPVNRQLFEMWKRKLPIIESRIIWAFYQYTEDILDQLKCFWPLPAHFVPDPGKPPLERPWGIIDHVGSVLCFDENDHLRGQNLLREMGLSDDDWFICFQAKDPAYNEFRSGTDSRSHRNCYIETYLAAVQHVTALGGYAVRIGFGSSRSLPGNFGPRVVDYTNNFRSDFGDIYLLGNCRFFLGSSTGTIALPPLFGVPVAVANCLPYTVDPLTRRSFYTPKLLKERRTGRMLHFKEVFDYLGGKDAFISPPAAFDQPSIYNNDIIELVDNTEDEILDLTLDMLDRDVGIPLNPDAAQLQALFKEIFYQSLPDFIDHGPCIGPQFALKYRGLIE
jgi:putative glycosyltransferase (TIGR04372 family)